jgi:hypothetical protein
MSVFTLVGFQKGVRSSRVRCLKKVDVNAGARLLQRFLFSDIVAQEPLGPQRLLVAFVWHMGAFLSPSHIVVYVVRSYPALSIHIVLISSF